MPTTTSRKVSQSTQESEIAHSLVLSWQKRLKYWLYSVNFSKMRLVSKDICKIFSDFDSSLTAKLRSGDLVKPVKNEVVVVSMLGEIPDTTWCESRFELRIIARDEKVPYSDLETIENQLITAVESIREATNSLGAWIFQSRMESNRFEGYGANKERVLVRDCTIKYVR